VRQACLSCLDAPVPRLISCDDSGLHHWLMPQPTRSCSIGEIWFPAGGAGSVIGSPNQVSRRSS
jgi:hypothetical protein